jgi:hypothetical protein
VLKTSEIALNVNGKPAAPFRKTAAGADTAKPFLTASGLNTTALLCSA